jgi:hypothetical protein
MLDIGNRITYGDGNFGTLLYQASPGKWIVETSDGGRDYVSEKDMTLPSRLESSGKGFGKPDRARSDELEKVRSENERLRRIVEAQVEQIEARDKLIEVQGKQIGSLKDLSENQGRIIEAQDKQIGSLTETIRNAKDITPIERTSFARVRRMARAACLELTRVGKLLVLSMGKVSRQFRSLKEIWEFLSQEDWHLSDLFPQIDPSSPLPQSSSPRSSRPCKYCGNLIYWLRSELGRWLPHNIGTSDRHRCLNLPQREAIPDLPY